MHPASVGSAGFDGQLASATIQWRDDLRELRHGCFMCHIQLHFQPRYARQAAEGFGAFYRKAWCFVAGPHVHFAIEQKALRVFCPLGKLCADRLVKTSYRKLAAIVRKIRNHETLPLA